jgi:hypothetical protein
MVFPRNVTETDSLDGCGRAQVQRQLLLASSVYASGVETRGGVVTKGTAASLGNATLQASGQVRSLRTRAAGERVEPRILENWQ